MKLPQRSPPCLAPNLTSRCLIASTVWGWRQQQQQDAGRSGGCGSTSCGVWSAAPARPLSRTAAATTTTARRQERRRTSSERQGQHGLTWTLRQARVWGRRQQQQMPAAVSVEAVPCGSDRMCGGSSSSTACSRGLLVLRGTVLRSLCFV